MSCLLKSCCMRSIELTTRSVAALGHIRRRIECFRNELLRFGLPPRRLAGRQELLHDKCSASIASKGPLRKRSREIGVKT